MKNFALQKTAKNLEIETFARRETFENHLSDKGLESRIHKEIS